MFKFTKLIAVLFFVIFNSISLFSFEFQYIKEIEVGNEPVAVFYDELGSQFHVFCKGTDKNFNFVFEPDSGDVIPTWWTLKIDKTGDVKELKKVKDFEFNSIPFPFYPAISTKDRLIFINHSDGIASYSLDNYQQIGLKLDFTSVNGLDYQSGHLLISQTNYGASIDTIVVYSVAQNKVMNKYPVGKNLIYAKTFQPQNPDFKGIAAISVGSFGSDSSSLHIAQFPHFQKPEFKDILIGNTANNIDIIDNKFAVVPVMMNNKLILTDLQDDSYFNTIELGESPTWDGPSFSKFCKIYSDENSTMSEYFIFSATYSGKFEIYQFSNVEQPQGGYDRAVEHLKTIDLQNKGQATDFWKDSESGSINVIVANSLKADYSANNTVSLISIQGINSVTDNNEQPMFTLANNQLRFNGKMYNNSVFSIYDIFGNIAVICQNTNFISTQNLTSGTYIAKFFDGLKHHIFKFNIIR